jgi:nucleotide-binding universal stress UspA family protein
MGDITHIVVGIDSSDYSRQALDWASREAESHGARLVIVR